MRTNKTVSRREPFRFEMTDRAAIITRMADDVSDLAGKFGMDRDVTDNDLIRLGWEPRQIRAHRADVLARVYRRRHESGKLIPKIVESRQVSGGNAGA